MKNILKFLILLLLYSCSSPLLKEGNYVLVEGGTFIMGDVYGYGEEKDERPLHDVTIDSFYISKYEVTQKEYEEIMGYNPSIFKGDKNPVEFISWYDAVMYANKLSEKEGLSPYYEISDVKMLLNSSIIKNVKVSIVGGNGYRLPTEAEWEYAARGGNKSKGYKYSGSNNIDEVAWYDQNSNSSTQPVGGKKPNELGIYDMSGNVEEYCWDIYGEYTYDIQTNPTGITDEYERVARGGRWDIGAMFLRTANRNFCEPNDGYNYSGFRLVRSYSNGAEGERQESIVDSENEESSNEDVLEKECQQVVNNFKTILKSGDKEELAKLIQYPLRREFPLPSIDDSYDFIQRYNHIFDKKIINEILNSSTEKDWDHLGWRGICFQGNSGNIWMDENGYITGIWYSTKEEKVFKQSIIDYDKESLSESLREFKEPILYYETQSYRVRIDRMQDDSLRCILWSINKETTEEPDMVFTKEVEPIVHPGSKDAVYAFKNNKYRVQIKLYYMSAEGEGIGGIDIYNGEKLILEETIYDPRDLVDPMVSD